MEKNCRCLLGVFLVGSLGLFLWVRSVLASDAVQIVSIEAERTTVGGLTIDQMRGRAVALDAAITAEPLIFGRPDLSLEGVGVGH